MIKHSHASRFLLPLLLLLGGATTRAQEFSPGASTNAKPCPTIKD